METIKRREFIRGAARAVAAASTAGCGILLRGCATGKDYDLAVCGGLVLDGSGGPPVRADVGILGDSIKMVGKISPARARAVFRADGLTVSPGFIDIHDHTAEGLLVNPKAESSVRQGITTLVSGNCGDSVFPLNGPMFEEARKSLMAESGLDLTWRDAGGFFDRLARMGTAVNYASFVGHGTVRAAAMGYGNRPAAASEMEQMKALVREAMGQGTLGLSTGLEYSPGSFGPTEELIGLCRTAAANGGLYATHMRDEEEGILEAVEEAFRICRETPIRLQISHLKIGYVKNWPKFEALMDLISRAREEGLEFRCDRYPYVAWATGLSQFFPLWSREGTARDFIARLKDRSLQERLRAEVLEKEKVLGSWDKVLISDVASEKNRVLEGANILEASLRAGLGPYEFMRALLIEEEGRVGMITFGMSEDHLRRLLAHPFVGIGSDGSAVAPYGKLARGKPHPRLYGSFPRALGKYVREEKIIPLEEMVRKITSMPAAHLGFVRRGRVKIGWAADLSVFDPSRIVDRATWAEPARYPEGIEGVIVNGRVVVRGSEHTGELPGKILRKNAQGAVA